MLAFSILITRLFSQRRLLSRTFRYFIFLITVNSVKSFSLLHLWGIFSWLVRCYAFMIRWLPLSLLSSGLQDNRSSSTQDSFETLFRCMGCFPFDLGPYHPRSHCFFVLLDILSLVEPTSSILPVLYLRGFIRNAELQFISRKTSYLQVWLAFHS